MRRRRRVPSLTECLCAIMLGTWLDPMPAAAAGIHDLADGWLLGPAATAEFLSGPAPAGSGAWATAGQSRLYGLPTLPVVGVDLGLRWIAGPGQPSVAASWQTLGQGLFATTDWRWHLQAGQRPALGVAMQSLTVRSGGEVDIARHSETHWQVALTVQTEWRPTPSAAVQAQLWLSLDAADRWWDGQARRPLLRMQGWRGPMALAVAVDLKPDQTPVVSLEWALSWGGGGCGLRADPATGTVGPILVWRRGSLLVRTSHLAHPQLGVTHRIQLGIGAWGAPRW